MRCAHRLLEHLHREWGLVWAGRGATGVLALALTVASAAPGSTQGLYPPSQDGQSAVILLMT
jgi:hypothetical protein